MKLSIFFLVLILFSASFIIANGDDKIMQRREEDKRRYGDVGINGVIRHRRNGGSEYRPTIEDRILKEVYDSPAIQVTLCYCVCMVGIMGVSMIRDKFKVD